MIIENKKEKRERKELRRMLANAYERPAENPDFTRQVMRKAQKLRPLPYWLRLCNKATEFFCSPIWSFVAIAIGIVLFHDKIITIASPLYNGQHFNATLCLQSILVLGGLFGLILLACKEMIHDPDN